MQPKQQIVDWLKRTDKETSMNKELERIIEQLHTAEPGEAFKQYVSRYGEGEEKGNLKTPDEAAPLSPYEHSLGKWPDEPAEPLSPFDQSSLHYVLRTLANRQGMVHVQSASLIDSKEWLKEVVAHLMVERAKQLITYSDPKNAFTYLKTVDGNKVYTLDPRLAGHEMTIISQREDDLHSIVQKLTEDEALHNSYRGQEGSSYFKATADNLYAYSSWGLLAAQPGHLGMAVGKDSIIGSMEHQTEEENAAEQVQPADNKNREKEERVLEEWQAASEQFKTVLAETESKRTTMIHWFELSKRCNDFEEEVHQLRKKKQQVEELRTQLRDKLQQSYRRIQQTRQKIEGLQQELAVCREKSFPLTSKLLQTKPYREHMEKEAKLHKEISGHYSSVSLYENDISGLEAKITNELEYESKLDKKIDFFLEEIRLTEDQMPEEARALQAGLTAPDKNGHQQTDWLPISSPWVTPSYNRKRSELFLAAMHLHECFNRAASAKMSGNIRLMGHSDAVEQGIDKAIWDSFTLLIPVIAVSPSTSLSLFKGLKQEELGWVVVDKSSLASTQSAVAAVWRAKRTIVLSTGED